MSQAGYLAFVAGNRRFLGFGFLMALASSFGQTYFIGVFGPAMQAEFSLSHTAWSTVYMAGTLASALLLPFSGRLIDRFDLRAYALAVCLLLGVAGGVTAAAGGPLALVLAVFLLRQSGQGLASHVALTSMARYFSGHRGRGIAIASLGFSVGEACLPLLAVLTIAALGWRQSYALVALLSLLGVAPLALWLLRGHAERHHAHLEALTRPTAPDRLHGPARSRAEVLRDPRFYLLMPGMVSPSLILTSLFFHHLNLADAKGWSHEWITGNYVVYAVVTVATMLLVGQLIDRFGALRLLPGMLLPLVLGLAAMASVDGAWVVWAYMTLIGVSTGMSHTLGSAVWAELYGVAHLGAIRSLTTAVAVFSSALGPVSAGLMMDAGVALTSVCLVYAGLALATSSLLLAGVRWRRSPG